SDSSHLSGRKTSAQRPYSLPLATESALDYPRSARHGARQNAPPEQRWRASSRARSTSLKKRVRVKRGFAADLWGFRFGRWVCGPGGAPPRGSLVLSAGGGRAVKAGPGGAARRGTLTARW